MNTETTPLELTGQSRIRSEAPRQQSCLRTAYDDQGRSYVEIDDEAWERATMSEWMGGFPDTWKRR